MRVLIFSKPIAISISNLDLNLFCCLYRTTFVSSRRGSSSSSLARRVLSSEIVFAFCGLSEDGINR